MNYILNKKLRLGPIRLTLSRKKNGEVVGEVLEPEGLFPHTPEEYRLGGRQGLYYRINHKGKRLSAHQGQEKLRGALMAAFFLTLSFTAASIMVWPNPWIPAFAFIGLGVFGGSLMAKDARKCREMYEAKLELDEALIDPDRNPSEEEIQRLTALSRNMAFPVQLREDLYQAVLDQVIDDHKITKEESTLLEAARTILALSDARVHDLHKELISSAWLHALEQGQLQEADFSWLGFVAEDLGLSQDEFEVELELVKELQEEPPRKMPEVSSSPQEIREDETLYVEQPVRMLNPTHKLRGASPDDSLPETVLVTSERMMIQGKHPKEIPLDTIREIELKVDEQNLILHQEGNVIPVRIRTEQPFRLGQILTMATEASTVTGDGLPMNPTS